MPHPVAAFEGCQLAPRHQRLKRTNREWPRRRVPQEEFAMRQAIVALSVSNRSRQAAPLPHPSWSGTEQKPAGRLSAEEFWARLGL